MSHKFHIPVLGLGYSIDTPLKVARYGISSVVSVVDDELTERMREFYSKKNNEEFTPIHKSEPDCRTRRISAYLNLLDKLVDQQFKELINQPFSPGSDITRYFELLPESSALKQGYDLMMDLPEGEGRSIFEAVLRRAMTKGSIDVNIMSKVDKMNFAADGEFLGDTNTDALAALRGFAQSDLESSVVLSAGMNPRLYSYLETFGDFMPDESGYFRKKIILKVSDFRSALIQAKFLAKKGLWVSEFRIESGLNCGGHAFATDGYLLGPILEEFKLKRTEMLTELYQLFQAALNAKSIGLSGIPLQKISVQGGIGTAEENAFLLDHYQMDMTGWGSPFLLVPEATNVDKDTLNQLECAEKSDFYLSNSSPLGVLFNSFKGSSGEKLRDERIKKGRPGSPCTKKYLVTNTEFTAEPICTASREYQHLKIKQLKTLNLTADQFQEQVDAVTEKVCLCEGLCASVYLKNEMSKPKENKAVSICPGPNLAYFKRSYSLEEMINHIYGSVDLLKGVARQHIFINELNLYVDYFQKELATYVKTLNDKKQKYLVKFKTELQSGIAYYKQLLPQLTTQKQKLIDLFEELHLAEEKLNALVV
jgi:hypothetical protein